MNTGLRGLDVHGLAVDPNTPAKLHALVREQGAYAASAEGAIFVSRDGGQRWNPVR